MTYAAVPGEDAKALRTAEVDLFIGRNYVVSIHRGRVPALEEASDAMDARRTDAARGGRIPRLRGARCDHRLLRPVHRRDRGRDRRDRDRLARPSDEEGVRSLLRLKRDLAALRRVLYPLRSVFQVLLRRDHPFFPGNTEVYLRDVFDHVLRILDDAGCRARHGLQPRWRHRWRSTRNRLNKTMKTLAVITVAVAVVGSVFGAYGMNFEAMPLASSPWGFWVVGLGTIVAGRVGPPGRLAAGLVVSVAVRRRERRSAQAAVIGSRDLPSRFRSPSPGRSDP